MNNIIRQIGYFFIYKENNMKKKIIILILGLVFNSIFFIGCNKKEVQPEIIPTNEITEIVEVDFGLEPAGK